MVFTVVESSFILTDNTQGGMPREAARSTWPNIQSDVREMSLITNVSKSFINDISVYVHETRGIFKRHAR